MGIKLSGLTLDLKKLAAVTPDTDPAFPTTIPNATVANMDRVLAITNSSTLATGRMTLALCRVWPGLVINKASFLSATTGFTPGTNQWFSLYDTAASPNLLAVTADDTSTAWSANSWKTLTYASPYTVPASTYLIYIGINVTGGTQPTLISGPGGVGIATASSTTLPQLAANIAPASLTNPASAPATATLGISAAGPPYVILS